MIIERKPKAPDSSHLFTIRVWVESANQDTRQVRIQVKHVLSGATRTFLQWSQAYASQAKLSIFADDDGSAF